MGSRGMKRYSKVVWPGFSGAPLPRNIPKIGRNEPCPCGSGKKYKDCHEREGSVFIEKLARKQDKQRRKEVRQHLKEQGVPWFRRLFLKS